MNDVAETLSAVLDEVRARLAQAARDRRSPMHVPVVGTADGDLRVMVLRGCAADLSALRLHTDARSPKVAAIAANPAINLLTYDPDARVQIRLRGTARVEIHGPVADAAWAEASAFARRCYMIEAGPGTRLDAPGSGLPAAVAGKLPSADQLLPARNNFAVILVEPVQLDWLHLAHAGHRRAQFTRAAVGQEWQGAWVVP